ncbi:ribosomal protein L10.e [Ferroglobus placidus DSM 10642]|uniref:Large ribosomal subunit protein uL16 n=1 Tax=Ferroglobus placidus (strain DSM 10642 / AEDII12DO) TaxID=589924 RepID=D3RX71_FERPA|nr:50S ribosomal protein L16 [Ferroglobus placidus]ADC65084.1 ribosomal protein L10.e [Ferroglobus placidus DSM 10642]
MARKPARMWRRLERPYTRKEYIDGVPGPRIRQFDMGNKTASFPVMVTLVAEEAVQIRDIALEAARVAANKYITKMAGSSNYYLKVRIYPHHVLREHKMAVGAGADRISQGMRKAFGKPVGLAAQVEPGTKIMSIWTKPEFFEAAKEALKRASQKLPTPTRIVVEKGAELLKGKV